MVYCEEHSKYTGFRRPSNECFSCWRVYLEKKDKDLADYTESISSKNPKLAQFLVRSKSNIMFAPVIKEIDMKASSGVEFSDVEELISEGFGEAFEDIPEEVVEELEDEEEVEKPKPQRGRFV